MTNQPKTKRQLSIRKQILYFLYDQILGAGGCPTVFDLIDLTGRIGDDMYLFKIQPMTSKNEFLWLKDIGPLYDHRYFNKQYGATLVLVVAKPIDDYMKKFLEEDRDIRVVWYENGAFDALPETKKKLAFLWHPILRTPELDSI